MGWGQLGLALVLQASLAALGGKGFCGFEGVLGTVLRVVMMLESRINNKKRLKKKKR